jgi:hypothetical protein
MPLPAIATAAVTALAILVKVCKVYLLSRVEWGRDPLVVLISGWARIRRQTYAEDSRDY